MKTVFSVDEAAQTLGLHRNTVLKYIRSDMLKAAKLGGQYVISAADLEALYRAKGGGSLWRSRVAEHDLMIESNPFTSTPQRQALFGESSVIQPDTVILHPPGANGQPVTCRVVKDGSWFLTIWSHRPKGPQAGSTYTPSRCLGETAYDALEAMAYAYDLQYMTDDPANVSWIESDEEERLSS